MTDLARRTVMLKQLASFTDAERLELLRSIVDDLFRFGYPLDGVGECMARNVERIHALGVPSEGGGE